MTGKLRFHPVYQRVLVAGRRGDTVFLDIGCCSTSFCPPLESIADTKIFSVGTDVRRLVYDGYPAKNVLATDLRQSFIGEGYELYRDSETSKIRFFTSNVFDIPTPSLPAPSEPSDTPFSQVAKLDDLQNQVTHMYMALLFHLFDEASQYEIAIKVGTLLKRSSGAIIFGRHQGAEVAGVISDNFFRYVRHIRKEFGTLI